MIGRLTGRPRQVATPNGAFVTALLTVDQGDGELLSLRIVAVDEPVRSALLQLADGAEVEVGGLVLATSADYDKAGVAHPTIGVLARSVSYEQDAPA
jgi:hypothetical protein